MWARKKGIEVRRSGFSHETDLKGLTGEELAKRIIGYKEFVEKNSGDVIFSLPGNTSAHNFEMEIRFSEDKYFSVSYNNDKKTPWRGYFYNRDSKTPFRGRRYSWNINQNFLTSSAKSTKYEDRMFEIIKHFVDTGDVP